MLKKIFVFTVLFVFLHTTEVMAQAISLSVSPPLFEAIVMPGKTVKQTYNLTNNSGVNLLKPKIVYFTAEGEAGNINLSDIKAPDWIFFDEKSSILTISPPEDAEEVDHFLTLVFENEVPVDLTNQNSVSLTSQIGSNILLTVSRDGKPKKSAEIIKFSTPKVIDSLLGKINYIVTLKNNGNSFWKPNGKIIINSGAGSRNEVLNLAPQNIISGSTRKILCLENENLIDCNLQSRFYIGKITSKLEFSIDDDPKIYKAGAVTYAIPFSLFTLILIILAIYKLFKYRNRK